MNELTDEQIESIYLDHRDQLPNIPLIRAVIAAERALQASRVAVPATDGWKLVPLEPTAEMLQAGQDTPVSESDEDAPEDYKAVYRAMLAAAPHPQQIAGLDKDAEIAALKAERDALHKNRHAREDAISGLRDDVEALLAMLPDELRTVFDSAKAKL